MDNEVPDVLLLLLEAFLGCSTHWTGWDFDDGAFICPFSAWGCIYLNQFWVWGGGYTDSRSGVTAFQQSGVTTFTSPQKSLNQGACEKVVG